MKIKIMQTYRRLYKDCGRHVGVDALIYREALKDFMRELERGKVV